MKNADNADTLLRGEIGVNDYWRKSGEQQVKSAGVFLTDNEQQRALKNLSRLALRLRQSGVCDLTHQALGQQLDPFGDEYAKLQLAFDQSLAAHR